MPTEASKAPQIASDLSSSVASNGPKLTIFGVPKPFIGHIGVIQRNALMSWASFGTDVEIILFGNEVGTAEYAELLNATHVPTIEHNQRGTPLLDGVFRVANDLAASPLLLYANCDILFLADLVPAITQAFQSDWDEFLLIGRRVDLDVDEMLDFESTKWQDQLTEHASTQGSLAPVVCKDYFGFRKGQFAEIPAFAIGRGNWDNWIVHHSIHTKIPVIDCTNQITALHQNHGYRHLESGRLEAYVNGDEAEENRRLAGGRHLVSGCAATWRMMADRIVPRRAPIASSFLGDLPRFAMLLGDLFTKRS